MDLFTGVQKKDSKKIIKYFGDKINDSIFAHR